MIFGPPVTLDDFNALFEPKAQAHHARSLRDPNADCEALARWVALNYTREMALTDRLEWDTLEAGSMGLYEAPIKTPDPLPSLEDQFLDRDL